MSTWSLVLVGRSPAMYQGRIKPVGPADELESMGLPTVRQQRGRWVVRVDGIDTDSGKARPRQLGTYASQRTARKAAAAAIGTGRERVERETVGELVDAWVESRIDVGSSQRQQYRWAGGHIRAGLGAISVERLSRDDIAAWLSRLASEGALSRRSIQIVRTTLKAALAAAVDAGEIRRNVAARVPMPRDVLGANRAKEADAWDESQLGQFLEVVADHRWGGPIRLEALYGLRRSELLALRWSAVDLETCVVIIEAGLTEVNGELVWSDGKSARSRRRIPIDGGTRAALAEHLERQRAERDKAGDLWQDHDLVAATHRGWPVRPRSYSHSLDRLVERAALPRLASHGLRHTAATHMVASASDLGEVRAAADLLGHSPEMLMRTYAHALPASIRTVMEKVGVRAPQPGP